VLPQGTGSRYIGEEAGKRRAALLCAAAEAFVPARKREFVSVSEFDLFFRDFTQWRLQWRSKRRRFKISPTSDNETSTVRHTFWCRRCGFRSLTARDLSIGFMYHDLSEYARGVRLDRRSI